MHRRRFIPTLLLAWLMVWIPQARADGSSKEYQIKAAFIYNFTQFVEWPADSFAGADAPFVVGVVGRDPFNGALDLAFANKMAGSHKVVVKHFDSIDVIESCQILFISDSEEHPTSNVLRRKLGIAAILSVGEYDSFLASGGGIRLFTEDKKIHFEVNLDAIEQARLKISSKLLKLAKVYSK